MRLVELDEGSEIAFWTASFSSLCVFAKVVKMWLSYSKHTYHIIKINTKE